MSEELDQYLTSAYRHDILGESLEIKMPAVSPKIIEEVRAAIAQIDALKLGPHLANRDFVSYQNRRALVALLEKLEEANG